MSLILTTNTSTNNNIDALNTGINRPYDYINFTTDTFEIEANSEVAVQSIKFNKEGNIEVNRQNNQFYVYLGSKDANGIPNQSTSLAMHTFLGADGDKNIQYNNDTLRKVIKRAIDDGMKHPDMVSNNQTNSSGTEVGITRDSEGKFTGYSLKMNYGITPTFADQKALMLFQDSLRTSPDELVNGSWNPATQRITKIADKPCEMIGTGMPISQCNGSLSIDFINAGGLWTAGLTRYLDNYSDSLADQNIGYFSPLGKSFYDYVAKSVFDTATSKYYLRIYHSVIDVDNESGGLILKEIDYTHVVALIEIFDTAAGYVVSEAGKPDVKSISRVEFNIQNERVICNVLNSDNTTKHVLFNGANASKIKNLKPTGATTKYLYPKVKVVEDADFLTILKFDGVKPTGFLYGGNLGTAGVIDGTLALGPQHYDFFNELYYSGDMGLGKEVDMRFMYDYDDKIGEEYAQYGMNASGAFRVNGTSKTSYGVALVLAGEVGVGPDDEGSFYPSDMANAQDILGFDDDPYLITPNASALVSETYNSINIPTQISTNSIFVRLNNFLQRSINGQTNGVSKIIYHVPRFDNGGNEFGGLFFEPSERVYVKLNNTSVMRRNEVSVSIVNPDETLAENITGKTIVMLHIRKSQ